jgi:Carbon-nitrogen hydrolase
MHFEGSILLLLFFINFELAASLFHMITFSTRQRIHVPIIRVLFSSTGVAACWISCCRAMSSSSLPPTPTPAAPSSSSCRIAVAQLCSTSNKYQNLLHIAKCAGMARHDKASMLFLPENCGFMGSNSSEMHIARPEMPIRIKGVIQKMPSNPPSVSQALMEQVNAFSAGKSIEIEEAAKSFDNSDVSILGGLSSIARASNLWISAGIHEGGAPPRLVETDLSPDLARCLPRTYNTHVILDSDGKIRAIYRKIHLFDVSIPGKVNLQESDGTVAGDQIVICDSPIGMCFCVVFLKHKVLCNVRWTTKQTLNF